MNGIVGWLGVAVVITVLLTLSRRSTRKQPAPPISPDAATEGRPSRNPVVAVVLAIVLVFFAWELLAGGLFSTTTHSHYEDDSGHYIDSTCEISGTTVDCKSSDNITP